MNLYITFGGSAYDDSIQQIVERAPGFGADKVLVYDDAWLLTTEFYRLNRWLWNYPATNDPKRRPRGFGWFSWKPFVIMHALNQCRDGDVVLYTDADTYPVSDFSDLYVYCRAVGGILLFNEIGCDHWQWCKADTFITMAQKADPKKRDHACARFMLFQKGPWLVQQLLSEWLAYCLNRYANTFEPSELYSETPWLKEPRCEQAILTNLAHKYDIKLHRTADQNGATQPDDKELYGQLFLQVGTTKPQTVEGSRFANV